MVPRWRKSQEEEVVMGAATSAATADLCQLSGRASDVLSTAERARSRVQDSQSRIQKLLLLFVHLQRALESCHREIEWIHDRISSLEVGTASERESLRHIAGWLGSAASVLAEIDREWSRVSTRIPAGAITKPLRASITRRLGELVCLAEDAAETAALGASEPFAQLVERELAGEAAPHVRP